jgi:putative ABC transport system substrate-binding protein
MRRRDIITMLGGVAAAWARIARAQSVAKRKPLIGFLSAQPRLAAAVVVSAFLDGMRDAGYEDGRNVDIAYRFADGRFERLPALAQELVALKPDVVLASSATPAALAARQATQTIQSCARRSSTRWPTDWSRATRDPAAMSPACPYTWRA